MTSHNPLIRRTARLAARAGTIGSAAALAIGISGLSPSGVPGASAAATDAGAAQVITPVSAPVGGGAPLNSGGSATDFSIKLPTGAACAGDSANDGYRVQSYRVPASVNPATLTFDASGPIGHQALYDTTGSPYVDKQTANADTPGGPGPIVNIADFDYGVYLPGDVTPGTYNLGIACTLGPASATQLDRFWNVQKSFVADAADEPASVRWTVVASSADPGPTTTTTTSTAQSTTTTSRAQSSTTTSTATSSNTTSTTSTTTTPAGGTSTPGANTAGGSGSGGASSGSVGGGPTVASLGATVGELPRTGSSPLALATWSFLLLCFGRISVLLGRTPSVLDPST